MWAVEVGVTITLGSGAKEYNFHVGTMYRAMATALEKNCYPVTDG